MHSVRHSQVYLRCQTGSRKGNGECIGEGFDRLEQGTQG